MPTSKATRPIDNARPAPRGTAPSQRRGDTRIRFILRAILPIVVFACGAPACVDAAPLPAAEPKPPPPDSPPVAFVYETADGGTLTSAQLHGRYVVIALAATYDLTSQAQLKVRGMVQRDHKPRLNVAALVLEPPENKPLVVAFAQGLDLHFPVALADERTIAGHGAFEGLRAVPSVVILDREGREVLRHIGPLDVKQLEAALASVEKNR